MGEEGLGLPIGFRFNPTDCELVEYYLKPHIVGQPVSRFIIRERQIYGDSANPWDVFGPEILDGRFKKQGGVYVFVRLQRKKKKSFNNNNNNNNNDDDDEDNFGKNFVRIAGCGTWDGKTHKPIMEDGKKVGVKRSLVFEMFDTDDNRKRLLLDPPHYWTIHEYSVPDGFPNPHDLVLCFVSVDDSKSPKIKRNVKGRRVFDSKKKKGDNDGGGLDRKKKRKSRVVDDHVVTSGSSGVDEEAFASTSTSCGGGVSGLKREIARKEDGGVLKNKGKKMVVRRDDGKRKEETRGDVVIIHDDEEALGLTSISFDAKEANNRLGMVQVEQNHCVGALASTNISCCGAEGRGSFMSLMLQQENCSGIVDTQFQLEYDVNSLDGVGSFQAMQDSFQLEGVNGCGVGCAGDYQFNMDYVGKHVVECSGEKNVQGFQENYFNDNFDMDEFVNYFDFGEIPGPVLYEQADEQLQGGENHGGQLVEEKNKGTNDVTQLLGKRKCEYQDSVMKKFCGSH